MTLLLASSYLYTAAADSLFLIFSLILFFLIYLFSFLLAAVTTYMCATAENLCLPSSSSSPTGKVHN